MTLFKENIFSGNNMLLDGGFNGKFQFNTNDVIGHGNFGKVFKGRNMYTYEEVAVKTEPIEGIWLREENKFYQILKVDQRNHNIEGLPEIYYISNIGLEYTAMAMELLGPSLNKLFEYCGNQFSLKTVLMIAVQLVSRIKYIHDCNIVHRDIKPENVLIGRPRQSLPYKESKENTIYLIDFGVANLFVDPKTDNHIPFSNEADVMGTYQFMSINTHLNIEQSRRDDLESLGYMLLYLVNGTLPWMKYLIEEINEIQCRKMKQQITVENLCNGLPEEFIKYFKYVKQLEFSERPDYDMLEQMFKSVYERSKFPDDTYDWLTL